MVSPQRSGLGILKGIQELLNTLIGLRRRIILLMALVLGTSLWGQNLKQFEKKVTEFTLANGIHFIVVERHEVPVVSFRTWIGVGSVQTQRAGRI